MFVVIPRHDRLRDVIEAAIQRLYGDRYGACLSSFAPTLLAELDERGHVTCAAGIRFGGDKFFFEHYLDRPIEKILRARVGGHIERETIVEVCHLAGNGVSGSLPFVAKLIQFLRSFDTEWAVFTATKPLRSLLQRNHLAMIELATADRTRVPDPGCWGHYFDYDPRIMAVDERAALKPQQAVLRPTLRQPETDARFF